MKESILRKKSYQFALRIIKLYQFIASEKREFVLSKQRLLRDSGYLTADQAESVLKDCEEIQKLLTSSIKTAKANLKK